MLTIRLTCSALLRLDGHKKIANFTQVYGFANNPSLDVITAHRQPPPPPPQPPQEYPRQHRVTARPWSTADRPNPAAIFWPSTMARRQNSSGRSSTGAVQGATKSVNGKGNDVRHTVCGPVRRPTGFDPSSVEPVRPDRVCPRIRSPDVEQPSCTRC